MIKVVTFCDRDTDAVEKLCRILNEKGLYARWEETGCADRHGGYYDVFIGDCEITDEYVKECQENQ